MTIRDNSGMTIIETMVAFSIMVIVYISVISAFPKGLQINKNSEHNSLAVFLAQEKLEELTATYYSDIATGTIENNVTLGTSTNDYFCNFRRTTVVSLVDSNLSATSTDVGLKKISVSVSYADNLLGQTRTYSLYKLESSK